MASLGSAPPIVFKQAFTTVAELEYADSPLVICIVLIEKIRGLLSKLKSRGINAIPIEIIPSLLDELPEMDFECVCGEKHLTSDLTPWVITRIAECYPWLFQIGNGDANISYIVIREKYNF